MMWCLAMVIGLAVGFAAGCGHEVTTDASGEDQPDDPNDDPKPKPNPENEEHPDGCSAEAWQGDVELGTGELCFEPVEQGASFALMAGSQGGYHLWVALRCADCEAVTRTGFGVKDAETGEWMYGDSQEQMVELYDFGSYREAAGLQAFMPGVPWEYENAEPDYLHRTMTIWLQVQIDGEMIEREVDVVLDHVEYWSPPCDDEQGEGCLG